MIQPLKRKFRLLVVDDEEGIRKYLKRLLEPEGYEVLLAATGEEAVQQFKEQPVDLALLDMHMPGVNGLDVLKLLKQMAPQLSVVMVTGNQDEGLALAAMKLGAFDYVTKPISKEQLFLTLQSKLLR